MHAAHEPHPDRRGHGVARTEVPVARAEVPVCGCKDDWYASTGRWLRRLRDLTGTCHEQCRCPADGARCDSSSWNTTACSFVHSIGPAQDPRTHFCGTKDSASWAWAPRNCRLELFEPVRFAELMRGRTLFVVGDAASQNAWLALGCLMASQLDPVATAAAGRDLRLANALPRCPNAATLAASPRSHRCVIPEALQPSIPQRPGVLVFRGGGRIELLTATSLIDSGGVPPTTPVLSPSAGLPSQAAWGARVAAVGKPQDVLLLHMGEHRSFNATHAKGFGMRLRSMFTFLKTNYKGQVVYDDYRSGLAAEERCSRYNVMRNRNVSRQAVDASQEAMRLADVMNTHVEHAASLTTMSHRTHFMRTQGMLAARCDRRDAHNFCIPGPAFAPVDLLFHLLRIQFNESAAAARAAGGEVPLGSLCTNGLAGQQIGGRRDTGSAFAFGNGGRQW